MHSTRKHMHMCKHAYITCVAYIFLLMYKHKENANLSSAVKTICLALFTKTFKPVCETAGVRGWDVAVRWSTCLACTTPSDLWRCQEYETAAFYSYHGCLKIWGSQGAKPLSLHSCLLRDSPHAGILTELDTGLRDVWEGWTV